MGADYNVKMLIKTSEEAELIDAVQRYMENATNVLFPFDQEPDSIENISRIFLADYQGLFSIIGDGIYSSTFKATYGWDDVLYDWWSAMEPYLDKGSYMEVWSDEGSLEVKVF